MQGTYGMHSHVRQWVSCIARHDHDMMNCESCVAVMKVRCLPTFTTSPGLPHLSEPPTGHTRMVSYAGHEHSRSRAQHMEHNVTGLFA